MNTQDLFEEERKKFEESRLYQQAKKEHTPRPFHEKYKGLYNLGIFFSILFQICSALTAITAAAYPAKILLDSWPPALLVAAALLFGVEYGKRSSLGLYWRERHQFKTNNKIALVVAAPLLCLSVFLSMVGTPIVMKEVTPLPELINIEELTAEVSLKKDSVKVYWEKEAAKAENDAQEVHNKNNWKGVTSKEARPLQLAFTAKATALKDSVHIFQAQQEQKGVREIEQAKAENLKRIEVHQDTINNAGSWLMYVTLGMEILLVFIISGLKFYRFNSLAQFLAPKATTIEEKREALNDIHEEANAKQASDFETISKQNGETLSVCGGCGKSFKAKNSKKKWCTTKCKNDFHNAKRKAERKNNTNA